MDNSQKHVAIVGGGLVGALNACFLGKRGFKVDVYEQRQDIRTQEVVKGRSINLALSVRGRSALKAVGIEEEIVDNGIPMYARMIHDLDGTRRPIPYGKKDQYIMSVDRRRLNELLLTAAERYDSVTLHFDHRLVDSDLDKGEVTFERSNGEQVTIEADLIMGSDGAYSATRFQFMKFTRLDFSQEYVPHGYIELCIPSANGTFVMETNYLHIWARNKFMLIALPNTQDKSFVVTLFMPFELFESIKTEQDLITFFEDKFPDAVPLLGKKHLTEVFFNLKPLPLVSIKCYPYHIGGRAVLMGDAAHAMVPFYGQGMNAGFEDCLIFNDLLEKFNNDFDKVLPEFTRCRNQDAKAICDLAMYNYVEMRSSVNSRLFLLRKRVDNFLHWLMPNTWVPLYTTVSFTRIPYQQCIDNRKWQDKVLYRLMGLAGITSGIYGALLGWRWIKEHPEYALKELLANNPVLSKLSKLYDW